MNDEIKEILKNIKKVANRETASRNSLMEMKDKDYQLLLNYITNLQQENEQLITELNSYKSRIEKATNELFELKDMIYKPETRDENIPIQQKISSIIKQLNGRSDE